jgi:hypothetical protein
MPHSQEGEGISVGACSLGLIKKACCRCPGFGSFWGAKVTFFSTNVHPFTCFDCQRVVGHFFKLLPRHVYLEYLLNFEIFILTNQIFVKIQYFFASHILLLKVFKNFNFFENNIISVKAAKVVVGYFLF